MRVTPGCIVRLDRNSYEKNYLRIVRECLESEGLLSAVYDCDPDSSPTGLVIRRWTREVLTPASHPHAPREELRVVTYVEVIWPAGRCPKCPIEILIPVN